MTAEALFVRPPEPRPQKGKRLKRAAVLTGSVVGHALALSAFFWVHTDVPVPVEDAPMVVSLVDGPPKAPDPAPQPKPAAAPEPPKALVAQQRKVVRPMSARPHPDAQPAGETEMAQTGVQLSDAQIAGASSADAGPSGGECDMARWMQAALRKDPLVQAAVRTQPGKAIMVWNGDWVRNQGEDGKGLAAVREAIMWQVAFAPAACRAQPVHGLVLLSMTGAGLPSLAVGAGDWRWQDMLKKHPAFVER